LSSGKTYCTPTAKQSDVSWPVANLGKGCPDGVAKAYSRAEEDADTVGGLTTPAWIGIGVGVAVIIIIIIVVIIIVKKKKNDERV